MTAVLYTLAAAVTGTGAQTSKAFPRLGSGGGLTGRPTETGIIQVDIGGGTVSVELQGRLSEAHAWVVIKTYTADTIDEIVILPEIRINVASNSGGTVDVSLMLT